MDANHSTSERARDAVNLERLGTVEENEKAKKAEKKASGLVCVHSLRMSSIFPAQPGTLLAGSLVPCTRGMR